MGMESVLKEYEGYVDKIYDWVNLDSLRVLPGVIEAPINNTEYSSHSGATPSKYVEIDGQRYFLKYPTLKVGGLDEIFVELFVSFIAKKIGVDCIDQKLYIDHERKAIGLISPDFGRHVTYSDLGGRIEYGSLASTNVEQVVGLLKEKFKSSNVVIDEKEITEALNKMCLFDYLTKQNDRHGSNFAFIFEDRDGQNHVKLAPMFDNANAFLNRTSRQYLLSPNDSAYFGAGQQRLLNGEFRYMREQFEEMFSAENFKTLIEEFNSIYGVDKLYDSKGQFRAVALKIQAAVQNRLDHCRKREEQETFIPLEVTFAVLKRHRNELLANPKLAKEMSFQINNYYGSHGFDYSYENFYEGKSETFGKWKWYDECLQLALNPNNPEVEQAKREMERKQRFIYLEILKSTMKKQLLGGVREDALLDFVLFDDGKLLEDKPKYSNDRFNLYKVYTICSNYPLYKELRDWCAYVEEGGQITPQERREYKVVRKELKKYCKFVNSCTNKNLSNADREQLEDAGLRNDGKGLVEIEKK